MPKGHPVRNKLAKGTVGPLRGSDCGTDSGRRETRAPAMLSSEGAVVVASRGAQIEEAQGALLQSEGFAVKRAHAGASGSGGEVLGKGAGKCGDKEPTGKGRQEAVLSMLSTKSGREAAARALEDGMWAPGTRQRRSRRSTLCSGSRVQRASISPRSRLRR